MPLLDKDNSTETGYHDANIDITYSCNTIPNH